MSNGFQKIILSAIGLCLSFILFFPAQVYASGCCKMYEKKSTLLTIVKGAGCVAGFAAGGGAATPLTYGVGCVVGSKIAEKIVQKYNPKRCGDALSEQECSDQMRRTGEDYIGVFDDDNCGEIEGCSSIYTPTTVVQVPEVKITNPICWPENECDAVCQGPDECFSGQAPECTEGRGYCFTDATATELSVPIGGVASVRDMGSYIALIYNYLIGVVTIVAIVMIMYGGFRWVTAAGSQGRIGAAKETIIAAVIGLVLALFSYTILSVINPSLLQLSMPPIKRVRPIYFEVLPARCQDYTTEADCKENKYNFNSEYKGCQWKAFEGFGEQCTIAERDPGQPGNVCKAGDKCDRGKCTEKEIRLALGPYASNTARKYCTDGTMDMPCVWDTDCNKGLKCDEDIKACVGIKGGRPSMAECDNDGQCSSGLCYSGQCRPGLENKSCAKLGMQEGDDDLCSKSQGYKCVELGLGTSFHNFWCCPPSSRDGNGCYISCSIDSQCGKNAKGQDMYCWAVSTIAIFKKEGSDDKLPRNVAQWAGRCYIKEPSGNYCLNDSGCASNKCDGMKAKNRDDGDIKDLITGPDGQVIVFPGGYDEIMVGKCQ
ncbi:pilin [Patescibacteria group bacterium]|nr:pilin [Patescibacteria group bacterium]MBU1922427.1 pilin [Patescibacteria group bacterium]